VSESQKRRNGAEWRNDCRQDKINVIRSLHDNEYVYSPQRQYTVTMSYYLRAKFLFMSCLFVMFVSVVCLSVIYYGRHTYAWKAIIFCRGSFFKRCPQWLPEGTYPNFFTCSEVVYFRWFHDNIYLRKETRYRQTGNRFYIKKTPYTYMFSKFYQLWRTNG